MFDLLWFGAGFATGVFVGVLVGVILMSIFVMAGDAGTRMGVK